MEVSGIEPQKDLRDEPLELSGLTYGDLFDIVHTEVKKYFEETFDKPSGAYETDEEDLDEELQRILDELDFELK